jgi:hypothetical protein
VIYVTEWTEPTDQQLDQVLGRLGNEEHRRYFFERLENPRWLRGLHARQLFDAPPRPWTDAQGELRLSQWPEGDYLARVASNEPELAVEIVTKTQPTLNSLVHRSFVGVALAVPAAQSARLVPLARCWLASPSKGWLGSHRLAAWVAHLARGGEGAVALKLAKLLIEVSKSATPTNAGRGRGTRALTGVTTWLDSYDYGDVLRTMLPDLVAARGLDALELVNDQLERWLRHGGQGSVAHRADYSWLWRPSIAAHEQNMGNTIEDALIDASRDAALLLAERSEEKSADVVQAFERRRWTVFRRLALNLLADLVSARQDRNSVTFTRARTRVIDAGNLNDQGLVHEYSAVARAVLPLLDEGQIQTWTSLIERGPIIDETELPRRLAAGLEADGSVVAADGENQAAAAASRDQDGSARSGSGGEKSGESVEAILDERVKLCRDRWRRDRLGAVRDALPPPLRARYSELAQRLGDAEHSDFASYTSAMWTGPTSPLSQQEILALSIDDLISYLQQWRPQPSGWPPAPSIEGLARELATAVTASPHRFAERAENFAACGPSFARAVLEGLEGALRDGQSFPWQSVIRLCAAVAAQVDDDGEADAGVQDEDPGWRWAQKEAASLLLQGLQPSPEELPRSLGGEVLVVLAQFVESSDPTPHDDEQHCGSDSEDPVTVALNSTRGQALRGIIAYAAWKVRQDEIQTHVLPGAPQSSTSADKTGTDPDAELGDVANILDRHLDPSVDPSPAVRSVYGQHFGVLLRVMPEWAPSLSTRIFGSGLPLSRQQYAAGLAFLAFNQPTTGMLGALRPQYSAWVKAVAAGVFDQKPFYSLESIAGRLAAHLLLLYTWGRIELETGLLADFFKTAPGQVRRDALDHLGWQLSISEQAIPDDVLARLQTLWESRRRAILDAVEAGTSAKEGTSPAAELTAFGWWFRSDRFDRRWALRELLIVLDCIADVERIDVDITEQVAQAAHLDLDVALRVFTRLLHSARQSWRLTEIVHEGCEILAAALDSGRPELVERANRLINEIASWGFVDIRSRVQAAFAGENSENRSS